MSICEVEDRARLSAGTSHEAIYTLVTKIVRERAPTGGNLLDVGCGTGRIWSRLRESFDQYTGVDVVQYDGFPEEQNFLKTDLNAATWPISPSAARLVLAIETIEHVENPRAFFRELVRAVEPGGWVVVTTPNNLSFLSKLTLVCKNCFNAFQEPNYPAHLSALLEIDLRRLAQENDLIEIQIAYTQQGRIPGTAVHFPVRLSRFAPRAFSDNVLIVGKKPRLGGSL
jgi:SAM-dependent methyltransferase